VRDNLEELVAGMNALAGNNLLDLAHIRREIEARDLQFDNPFSKDSQVMAIHNARRYRGDKLTRVAKPHRMLDPANGPLIAVRLNILTRKSLGGFETDLDARVLAPTASHHPVSTLPAKPPVSVAADCTVIVHWKAASSAAACSPGASLVAPRQRPAHDRFDRARRRLWRR
jgi:predicted oxidoreductase